jgi:hypothetical protein
MAKQSKTATIDGLDAACCASAAMTRALKVLEARHKGEKLRLNPGTHAVDLTIRIAGDLSQAPDVVSAESEPKPTPMFSERELLGALLMPHDDTERRRLIKSAVTRLGKALTREGKTGGADAALEATLVTLKAESLEFATKAGLVTDAKSGGGVKAGALTGKPGVEVRGRVGERVVEVAIAQESVGGAG